MLTPSDFSLGRPGPGGLLTLGLQLPLASMALLPTAAPWKSERLIPCVAGVEPPKKQNWVGKNGNDIVCKCIQFCEVDIGWYLKMDDHAQWLVIPMPSTVKYSPIKIMIIAWDSERSAKVIAICPHRIRRQKLQSSMSYPLTHLESNQVSMETS